MSGYPAAYRVDWAARTISRAGTLLFVVALVSWPLGLAPFPVWEMLIGLSLALTAASRWRLRKIGRIDRGQSETPRRPELGLIGRYQYKDALKIEGHALQERQLAAEAESEGKHDKAAKHIRRAERYERYAIEMKQLAQRGW